MLVGWSDRMSVRSMQGDDDDDHGDAGMGGRGWEIRPAPALEGGWCPP
ncbi:hypothetical protein chiPu_0029714, partial [Chiloscyllium punctatum]|nr:hypothetical protein [Chiloscyllium punctatum]